MATLDVAQTQEMNASALSYRLRSETKEAHTAAERSGIMGELLRGRIDTASYVRLLQNLAALYNALETELDQHRNNSVLRALNLSVLRRLPSLQHDIAMLQGFANALNAPPSAANAGGLPTSLASITESLVPATREYVSHLHTLGETTPALLFAHAYLRYLGDLYGGQIMKGIIQKSLGAHTTGALTFYEFPHIADMSAFKEEFRERIDALELTPSEHDAMVGEALSGYELHARMFRELTQRHESVV